MRRRVSSGARRREPVPPTYDAAAVQARFDTWADPLLDVCAQVVGAALAAVVGAWALGADAPDPSTQQP